MITTSEIIKNNIINEPIIRDSRGVILEIGLNVAYNRSGVVVLGKIVAVTKNEWKEVRKGWQYLKFEMLIKNIDDDKMSIIKNPNSFVII